MFVNVFSYWFCGRCSGIREDFVFRNLWFVGIDRFIDRLLYFKVMDIVMEMVLGWLGSRGVGFGVGGLGWILYLGWMSRSFEEMKMYFRRNKELNILICS